MPSAAAVPGALRDALRDARHVCVLTGAGVSAESGVPTFREAQSGLWAKYDPLELATPDAFARDPGLVWRWYRWRRDLVASVEREIKESNFDCGAFNCCPLSHFISIFEGYGRHSPYG